MPTQKLSPLLYLAGKNGNGHAASGAEEEEGAEGKRRREKDISGNAAWTPVPDRAGGFNGQVAGPAKPAAKENGGKTVGEDVAKGTGGGNGTGARIAEAESLGPVAGLARSAGRLKRRRVLAVGEPEVAALVEAGFLLPKCLSPGACAEWQAHQADAGYWLRLAVDTGYAAHQVAARSGLSQRQLERLWPEWFGLGLGQWLHGVRLTLAAFWLWRGEDPQATSRRRCAMRCSVISAVPSSGSFL
jgi:AraC-like DNA-binding protein